MEKCRCQREEQDNGSNLVNAESMKNELIDHVKTSITAFMMPGENQCNAIR